MAVSFQGKRHNAEDLQFVFCGKNDRCVVRIMGDELKTRMRLQLLHGKFARDRRNHNIAMNGV